jgi:hypothetical protein
MFLSLSVKEQNNMNKKRRKKERVTKIIIIFFRYIINVMRLLNQSLYTWKLTNIVIHHSNNFLSEHQQKNLSYISNKII